VSSGAITRDLFLGLATAPFFYYVFALVAAARFSRGKAQPQSDFTPPVSLLKPIRGLDRETYENYGSFCRQDYPEFELIFCVSDEQDSAIPVIEKIIADFPGRPIRLLIGSQPLGVSDKVNKLCRLVREARHEIVIISDSDVRVAPGFLRKFVANFRNPEIGGLSCLYRGISDGSIGSDLETLGNSSDFVPGVLVASLMGSVDFMLGAVMGTTKRQLAAIGGFESLVDHLSDDYELGNRITKAGHRVEISCDPVDIVYPRQSLAQALRHQLRWNMTVRCSRPWGHFGLLFSQGLPWTVLAMILAPSWHVATAYLLAYAGLRAVVAWRIGVSLMGDSLVKRKLWMLPLRDAVAFFIWLWSFFPHRIHWRGQEFYIRDKRLVPVTSR
jgi:ceramide glucosyltransferase